MTPLTVSITTVGCRANQADSAQLGRSLDPDRFRVVASREGADVYVINSCAVTAAAERDVRRALWRARRLSGDHARVLLTGCMVTACPERVEALQPLWRVVPSLERARIPQMLAELVPGGALEDRGGVQTPEALRRTRPSLRVQDGCAMRCAYCAVPAGRGRERSVPASEVRAQLGERVAEGAREVVICGINLGRWGHDLRPRQRLADLVGELEQVTEVERLRLSSIEPFAFDDALIDRVASSARLAPHLHLPLQSGDDEVLKRMRRPYLAEQVRDLVARLIRARPELSIGVDLIAGFPGESLAAFERTAALVQSLPLTYVHAFGFSPRPGTDAAEMEGQVPKDEVKRRVAALREIGRDHRRRFAAALVGQRMSPLIEPPSRPEGPLRGVAGRFVTVEVSGARERVNRITPVIVQRARDDGVVEGRPLSR